MEIEQILSNAVNLAIEVNKNIAKKKTDKVGMHDLYEDCCKMADEVAIHAVKGIFPDKLFSSRSPNETQQETTYIKENYKQLTLPVFVDYISTIGRAMGDGNWSIDYKEDSTEYKTANKTFESYVTKELPIYGSLEAFVKFILPSIKTIDANGFLAIRPKEIDYTTIQKSEDNPYVKENQGNSGKRN